MVMGEIQAGMTAFDTAISTLKKISDLTKTAENLELQEAILQLRQALLDAKEENLDLRQKIQSLFVQVSKKEELILDRGMYFHPENDHSGPFCQVCLDRDNRVINLYYHPATKYRNAVYECKVCGNKFPDEPGKPEPELSTQPSPLKV